MRKTIIAVTLTALLALTACGPAYIAQPADPYAPQPSGWNGDPCDQSYFDAIACQTAINLGGWYLNGMLIHHYYGGYGYNHYYQANHVYVLHGGSVHSYSQSVRVVQSRPQATQPASSVSSAGKVYVPPSQRASAAPAGSASSASSASRPYTPPSRPSSSYSPASRPASSYSSPRRK